MTPVAINVRRRLAALAGLLFLSGAVFGQTGTTFNVRDYGAVGDGKTLDSPAIQKALDACAKAGGGTVRLGPGAYLSEPLFLRGNNLTVQLDDGAVLQGVEDFAAYRTGGLINADRLTNVCLCGAGVIDGGGAPWWPAVKEAKRTGGPEPRRRPKMVNFHRCHGLTVRDVTLRNSPSFHLVPVECDGVLIDHVTIKAPGNSPNTDAIDPSACRQVLIVNCLLDVGDDNVAIKAGHEVPGREFCCEDITVSNCVCLHGHGISIGSETSAGLSNLVVVHCSFEGTVSGLRIKTTREKGGKVEHILYSDLVMENVRRPIDISCYYPKIPTNDAARPMSATTPAYSDIRIENVTASSPESAGLIVGLPESPVSNVILSNVHLKAQTGLLVKNTQWVQFKDVTINVQRGEPVIVEK